VCISGLEKTSRNDDLVAVIGPITRGTHAACTKKDRHYKSMRYVVVSRPKRLRQSGAFPDAPQRKAPSCYFWSMPTPNSVQQRFPHWRVLKSSLGFAVACALLLLFQTAGLAAKEWPMSNDPAFDARDPLNNSRGRDGG
jgi:hypothetical protein